MPKLRVSENGKIIELNDNNFLASGGEGDVYKIHNKIYKIYQQKPTFNLEGKIKELSVLRNPNILKPEIPLYINNDAVGFTMKYATGTEALPKMFTNSYRTRNNIDNKISIELIKDFLKLVQSAHDQNVLIVDMNEFNFLVSKKTYTSIYAIDVDSWLTKSFPATAIMPTIQDFHTKGFSDLSDWYSFAIIAFQIITGIHPFKGKYTQEPRMKVLDRMKKSLSVFNHSVNIPKSARSLDLIPSDLRVWMEDLFENNKRSLPPMIQGKVIAKPQITKVHGTDNIIMKEISDLGILRVEVIENNPIYYTKEGIYYRNHLYSGLSSHQEVIILNGALFTVEVVNGTLSLVNRLTNASMIKNKLNITSVAVINNRIYGILHDPLTNSKKFVNVNLVKISDTYLASIKTSYDILNSSTFFKNVLYSNIFGSCYVYVPFKENNVQITNITELKGHKIIDMKYERQFLEIISYHNGIYFLNSIRFNSSHSTYMFHNFEVDICETNFTVLPNGVVVILENGNLHVTTIKDTQEKLLDTPNLSDGVLYNTGKVNIILGKKAYEISMK